MEDFFKKNLPAGEAGQKLVIYLLLGLILIGFGVILYKGGVFEPSTKVEVLNSITEPQNQGEITIEIAGEVEKPGVYKLPSDSRVNDLLEAGGGLSANANRDWVDKNINRASKLSDGQKIYIPSHSEVLSAKQTLGVQTISTSFSSETEDLVNINAASLSELDKLPGIGPVYGQKIIDHRPYSTVEELLTKGVINKSTYEKIKEGITIY